MKTKINPYRKIDITRTDQAYWEKVLSDTGSGMSRGDLRNDPVQKTAIRLLLLGTPEDIAGFFGGSRVLGVEELIEAEEKGLNIIEIEE